jgi:hydrophobe/amphiphile efflux-1 (HAE1) family protein
MWISNFSIRNPIVTVVSMLVMVVFGAIALLLLNTDEYPEVNPPLINISIPYPGASPEGVEREIINPLEESFASISGVDNIRSTAMDGFALISVVFDFGKDLKLASQELRDKISENRNDLPPEMEEPILKQFDPNELPIISLTLSSETLSVLELTQLADPGLTGALRGIPGVANVDVVGGLERELTVELQPHALHAAGVGVEHVVQALRQQNLAAPVGRLSGQHSERTIRLSGRLEQPTDFTQLVIGSVNGRVVRLGDVATVRDSSEEPRSMALYNGRQAVGIDIIKTQSANTTSVSERVREQLATLSKTLPQGVTLEVVRDAGPRVESSVKDVESSLFEGAFLTVLVVFLFLRSWRSTVITGLALPVSVLTSFVALWAFGFTLNIMSLLGLSLAIGILIDDAIVVRENIVRHMEMGKDHVTAAREGTAEIGLAVTATTLSIVVVFVPLAFMGGFAEEFFAPFSLTIASSVLISLFVSFSLDPMLSAVWADPEVEGKHRTWMTRWLDGFNNWLDRQTELYRRIIGWALLHRWAMVLIAFVSFFGALAMPVVGLVGGEFSPKEDRNEFTLHLETPPGSNLDYMRLKALEVVRMAHEYPEVVHTYATIGGQGGAVDTADVYVRLKPKDQRTVDQHTIADSLRTRAQRLSGMTASLNTGGFGVQKQIQLKLSGPDMKVLTTIADQMLAEVKQVPGAVDVGLSTRGQKPEVNVVLDRELAGSMGLMAGQVAQALRPAFAGIDVGDWVDPTGETRDVVVRLPSAERSSPAHLRSLPIVLIDNTGRSSILPLGQVADVKESQGPALINHLDRQRVIMVEANTDNRPLTQVVADIEKRFEKIPLPPGYTFSHGGETESQRDLFGRLLLSLAIAIMLMYFILVVQLGSFLDPLPIIASLPLSLIGVMLALLVTGSTLNLMSMIGVVLLMGIVAKNAILLIDFAKWTMEKGVERKAALIEAGGVRLRPILMTSMAIIAGMLPVAIGSGEGGDFRAPLGRAVIGGTITSTLLTLLLIPTFYDMVAGWREKLFSLLWRKKAPPPPPGEMAPPKLEHASDHKAA